MGSSEYAGKTAYQGETAARYDADRKQEPLWAAEDEFVAAWAAGLPDGASVLDLPTGTGRFVDLLLARGLRVYAMDVSADMLGELRRRDCARNPRLHIMEGDAERLALERRSVDYVLCWRFIHLLPLGAVERVLKELGRVCRREILLQGLPVRVAGWRAHIPAGVRVLARPFRRALVRSGATPWSHIPSFVHAEPDLLRRFARAQLHVTKRQTLADYHGLPVRVYALQPRDP